MISMTCPPSGAAVCSVHGGNFFQKAFGRYRISLPEHSTTTTVTTNHHTTAANITTTTTTANNITQ